MTQFAQLHAITDICFLVGDIEKSVTFYTEKLGFILRRRADGFADFKGAGVTLALWEIDHIASHTGISNRRGPAAVHKACAAVELPTPAAVDATYGELLGAGVTFGGPPATYEWNARACYFSDPDDNLWEIYAWADGGPVGDVDN